MEYKTIDPRAVEQQSADALNRLIAHLRAFHNCRQQLDHVQDMVGGDATHNDSTANHACRLLDKAMENLDTALAIVVEVRLREIAW